MVGGKARLAAGFTLALCLVAGAVPSRPALQTPEESPRPAEATFEGEIVLARKDLAAKLGALADWCATAKLYAERDKVYETLLRFDPANEQAHRGLKHSQQRDGTWTVPDKRPESRNYNNGRLDECVEKRRAVAGEFRERALALLEFYAKDLPPGARQQVVDDALAIDPDDPATRELAGEVKRDDVWVLEETVAGKERRAALKDLIASTAAAVPAPSGVEPAAHEKTLGVTWTAAIATPSVRVLSTGPLDEAKKVAVMCSTADAVFRAVSGAKQASPKGLTIYLLTNQASRDAFLGAWPGWSADERARLKTWAGAGVPGDIHHARWDADAPRRLDGAVRHVIGLLTLLNFGYDHQKCAWAWEGVGLYLTRELVGTRYTWYSTGPTTGDAESKELLGKLMMQDVNWMNEAYQRAKRGKMPKLEALCARRIDQFGVDEVLASYALAAYLIEGRPDEFGEVEKRIAKDGSAKALSSALGADLAALDAKLVRWLSERK
jgi:hypothetical protein